MEKVDRIGVANPIPGVVYPDPDHLRSYVERGVLTHETLASAFADIVKRFPGRTALSEPDWSCSFSELDALTDKAASAFIRLGLAPLDRVLFQVPNSKELVISVLGCLKAGLIPICTLVAHRRLEIGYLGRHASARAHFVSANDPRFDFIDFAREMRKEIPTLIATIVTAGSTDEVDPAVHQLAACIERENATEAKQRVSAISLDPFQIAFFQLSGGTTGVPKIIPRFHNEYLYTIRTVIAFHALDENTVAFTPNPMMHNAPMICIWGPALFGGGEVATCTSLDVEVMGRLLTLRRPNWMLVTVPILNRMKDSGWLAKLDFSHVRGFSVTAGVARFSEMAGGAPTWPLFGMTEGIICYCNASDALEARHETVGRPLSEFDEIKILEPFSETEVQLGELGELAIRGPCTTRGYFDAEERNREAFTSDGFYRSGDLIRIRTIGERRYLIFAGRLKDVVDRGGEKVNCEEVENVALAHPAVGAIAIVGMPDRMYGERACAFVVLTSGIKSLSVSELGSFLQDRGMAKFKWPERIEIVDDFPLTSSGKISKPKLKELIIELLRREGTSSTVLAPAKSKAS
jgi:2,3-dihydroxybenzoate-AMP ligase